MTSDLNLEDAVTVRRIQLLYSKLPAGIVSALLGVLVIFVALLQIGAIDTIKAWASYMLSALALRGCFWYSFTNKTLLAQGSRRWEMIFTLGALLTGLGWGALNGPLYPDNHPEVHNIFLLAAVGVSFTSAVYYGISNWAFWAIVPPTLIPAIWRFAMENPGMQLAAYLAAGLGALLVITVQISFRRTLLDNLRRGMNSELLLAEQQAIFKSATLGIAVVNNKRIVKANPRLAELLGLTAPALMETPLENLFAKVSEFDLMMEESDVAFRRAQSFHGAFRLKRGDSSQFWAEFSGRRMDGDGPVRSVWLISEAPLRSGKPAVETADSRAFE